MIEDNFKMGIVVILIVMVTVVITLGFVKLYEYADQREKEEKEIFFNGTMKGHNDLEKEWIKKGVKCGIITIEDGNYTLMNGTIIKIDFEFVWLPCVEAELNRLINQTG